MGEDYIDQLMASGQGATMDDIVRMTTDNKDRHKAQDASLEKLKTQLLAGWQGLGENVGIGSAGTDKAEIGGRRLPIVAEEFARMLQTQGITDLSQAKFQPGQQAAWTAEGKGNVSLVTTKDGRLVPIWGSSSDAGKVRNIALTLASAWVAPGLAGALGGGLSGAAGAGALLGGTRAAVTGGDVLKGALTGGITGGIGQLASPYLADLGKTASQAVGGDMLGKIASGAVQGAGRSAIGAAMTGNSIVDALLSGAVGGATSAGTDILVKGTNATLGQYLKDVPAPIRNAVTSAATAGLLGKDIEKAAINSFIGSLMKGSPFAKKARDTSAPGVKTTDATTQQLLDIFGTPQDTGRVLGQVAGEIPSGMFDTNEGGSGDDYGDLPSWALDPYGTTDTQFGDWYQEGAIPTYSGVPEWDDAFDIALQTGKVPSKDTSETLEITGRRDDLSIDPWLQPFVDTERRVNVTEGEPQTVEVIGKRPENDVIIPDWDILPSPSPAPGPAPAAPAPAPGAPAPSPGAPAPAPRAPAPAPRSPAPSKEGSGLDLSALFALMGAMANQQQPTRTATGTSLARGTPESPFGLMYDLRG